MLDFGIKKEFVLLKKGLMGGIEGKKRKTFPKIKIENSESIFLKNKIQKNIYFIKKSYF